MNVTASLITHYKQEEFPDFSQIQQILEERNITLNYVNIDCKDIDSSVKAVRECAINSDYLIADSYASFYLRNETNSNAKILFDPVMKPSELKCVEDLGLAEKVKKMEDFINWYRDAEMRWTTYAVFENCTTENQSIDAKLFQEQYGCKFNNQIDNFCFSTRVTGFIKALDYFAAIHSKSKNDIDI